jgi:hypothetical protein
MLGISHGSVQSNPKYNPSMRWVAAKFATRLLGEEQNCVKTRQTKIIVDPHPPYSPHLMRDQNGFLRTERKTSGSSYRKKDGYGSFACCTHCMNLVAARAFTKVYKPRGSQKAK